MDGEVSQVVELECKGIYYLLKGSIEAISYMWKAIKALSEMKHKSWLKLPGECSWQKLQEVSKDPVPILEFPKEMFEIDPETNKCPFEMYCEDNDLQYCMMPDLNPDDDYLPVAIPSQDMAIHQEHIKTYMHLRIQAQEAADAEYEEQISQAEEELEDISEEEDPEAAEKQKEKIEELKTAKEQNQELLEESREKMEKDNIIDFEEYLKMGEQAGFKENPEEILKRAHEGTLVREYMPYECMYPIRDQGVIPESHEIYYSQKSPDHSVTTVRRHFDVDEMGMVYSTYHIMKKGKNAEPMIFCDKGMSREQWEEILPEMLREAGIVAEQPTAAIHSRDRLNAYVREIDANFNAASEEQGPKQEAEVQDLESGQSLMNSILQEEMQKRAYEESQYVTLEVSNDQMLFNDRGEISIETDRGLISGLYLQNFGDEFSTIRLKLEDSFPLALENGGKEQVSGQELMEICGKDKQQEPSRMPGLDHNAGRKGPGKGK